MFLVYFCFEIDSGDQELCIVDMARAVGVNVLEDLFYFVFVDFYEIFSEQCLFDLLIVQNTVVICVHFSKSIQQLNSFLTGQQLRDNISMHYSLQFIFELKLLVYLTWKFEILCRIYYLFLPSSFEILFFYFSQGLERAYLAVGLLLGSLLRRSLAKSILAEENFVL